MTESAQVFKGVHDTPTYTDVFFNKPMRLWVAVPLSLGLTSTLVATVLLLDSGYARATLVWGLLLTALTTAVGAVIPHGRPSLQFRLRSLWRAARPRSATQRHPSAAGRAPRGDRQSQLHRARRLRPLSARRAALLLAAHQETPRRCRATRHPGPRIALRGNDLRPGGATRSASAAARDAARAPQPTHLGHRLCPDGAHPGRRKPPHPHLLADHPRRRRPRRSQPRRSAHQDRRLAGRTRQGIRSVPGGLPPVGRRRHHRATRRIRCHTGHRGHGRLVLAPQRLSRRVHCHPAAQAPTRPAVR